MKDISFYWRIMAVKGDDHLNLSKIVKNARESSIKRYDENKGFTNKDEGYEMIVFCTKTVSTRKVNDWGRDIDHDVYLGIDKSGWIIYSHHIEYLAGPIKIIDPKVEKVSDDYVTRYLQSEDCTDDEYLMFISTAYNLK